MSTASTTITTGSAATIRPCWHGPERRPSSPRCTAWRPPRPRCCSITSATWSSGRRLLDAGCGRGGTSIMANARFGCQADGVSISRHRWSSPTTRPASRGVADKVRYHFRNMLDTGFEAGGRSRRSGTTRHHVRRPASAVRRALAAAGARRPLRRHHRLLQRRDRRPSKAVSQIDAALHLQHPPAQRLLQGAWRPTGSPRSTSSTSPPTPSRTGSCGSSPRWPPASRDRSSGLSRGQLPLPADRRRPDRLTYNSDRGPSPPGVGLDHLCSKGSVSLKVPWSQVWLLLSVSSSAIVARLGAGHDGIGSTRCGIGGWWRATRGCRRTTPTCRPGTVAASEFPQGTGLPPR